MKYVLLLAVSIVSVSCARLPVLDRGPSGVFDDYDKGMNDLLRMTLPVKEQLGLEKPWEFVQGHYNCYSLASDTKAVTPSTPTDQELELALDSRKAMPVNQWIRAVNKRTFGILSCDQRYRDILTSLVQAEAIPNYQPATEISADGSSTTPYYRVSKFESMAFKQRSTAKIKSVVEIPKFTNPERTRLSSTKNAPISNEEPEVKMGNLTFSSKSYRDQFRCAIEVKNNINNQVIDEFLYVCSAATKATFAPLLWKGETYVIYPDLVYAAEGTGRIVSGDMVLRLHKVTSQLDSRSPVTKYFNEQQKEPVILNRLFKTSPGPSVAVPTEITVSTDAPNGNIRLALNALYNGDSYITVFEFRNSDFMLEKTIDVAIGLTATLQLNSLKADTLLYTSLSKQNLLSFHLFDLVRQRQIQGPSSIKMDHNQYLTKLLFYPTKDGRMLPMWITHGSSFHLRNPANFGVAETYGGFNSIESEAMNAGSVVYDAILKRDGFYASVIVRGGGELGPLEFFNATAQAKQRTYDDFIAATEFLYEMGYAGPRRIVAEGWSNGGLVVLKSALHRPELYGAVIAGSAVTDVLNVKRLDKENGQFWLDAEYGDLKNEKVKAYWQRNSPIEMLKKAKSLPPILLRTAYGDLNVNPTHSLKFYKALRTRPDRNQFLLFVRPLGGGHGPGSRKDLIEEYSYIQSFIFRTLDIP